MFQSDSPTRGAAIEVLEDAKQTTITDLQTFTQLFDASHPQAKTPAFDLSGGRLLQGHDPPKSIAVGPSAERQGDESQLTEQVH